MDDFPTPEKSPLDILVERAGAIERELLQERFRKERELYERRSKQKLWQLFWRVKWGIKDLVGKATRRGTPTDSKNSKTAEPMSIFGFYGTGFCRAIKKSWNRYGFVGGIGGFLYAIFAVSLSSWAKQKHPEVDVNLWLTTLIPLALFLIFLAYHLIRAPYEIYLELYAKMDKLEKERNALVIHSAMWGLEDTYRDVTDVALRHLANGRFEMPCDYKLLGDPIKGVRKNLIVYYSYNGGHLKKIFTEQVEHVARLP